MTFNEVNLPTTHGDVRTALNQIIGNTADNSITYKTVADLPSAVGGVRTFPDNGMTYIFDGVFDIGTDRMVFSGTSQEMKGSNCSSSTITSATTGIQIEATNSLLVSCLTIINTSTGTILSAIDANTDTLLIEKTAFVGGSQAISVKDYNGFIMSDSSIVNSTNGILLDGLITSVNIAGNAIYGVTGDMIDLGIFTTKGISLNHNVGIIEATSTGIKFLSSSANILANGYGSVEFNKFDNSLGGTLTTGYSPLDLGWLVIGNASMVDSDRLEPGGFGYYVDDNTGGAIVAGNGEGSAVQMTINGLGSATNTDSLPDVIKGVSQLWDTSTNKITPIYDGDQYNLRVSVQVTATDSNPTFLSCAMDIGTLTFPDIRIFEDTKTLRTGGFPQIYTFSFPIFTLTTFLANGGKFYFYCNSGTADLENRTILISRTGSGAKP